MDRSGVEARLLSTNGMWFRCRGNVSLPTSTATESPMSAATQAQVVWGLWVCLPDMGGDKHYFNRRGYNSHSAHGHPRPTMKKGDYIDLMEEARGARRAKLD